MRERHGNREVLLEPEEGVGVGVYVEDADGIDSEEDEEELDWAYGAVSPARLRWRPAPTAMPPMPITLR